jgi:hypothetical protein
MNLVLQTLKNNGHELLEEYISLDRTYRTAKQKRDYAYRKLSGKVNGQSHFSKMTEVKHVISANAALRKMIKKRKSNNEFWGIDKVKFAPNLMELQRNFKTKIL